MRTSDSSSNSSDENEESFTYNEQESTVTRSGRTVKIPQNLQDYEIYTAYCLLTKVDQDPKTYKEASIMLDWQQAIDKELSSHEKLETWQPAKLPVGQRAIDTRWLFKTKEDGTKKARLDAKGPEDQVQELLRDLRNEFNIKEMTEVKTFLGMEISKNEKGLKITQTRMITRLLEEFSMIETRNVATPMEVNFQVKEEEPIINNVPYRRLICSLMYLSLVSRPDISYSAAYLSRFLDKPRKSTWEAGKRILRYLNHTKEYGLQFKKGNMQELMALCDADWGGDQETRKSVSGFVCFHAGNPIAWHSRKQTCVAQSSMEAEYISAGIASQELVNLKGILSEFKIITNMVENAANFTFTYQHQPSIFEIIAQKSLNDTLHPALQKIALVLSTNAPQKFSWLNDYFEETFLCLNGLLQYYYLAYYDASFSENFYGLKRVLSNNKNLSKQHREYSLILLVILPFFKRKLEDKIAFIRIEQAEGCLRNDIEGKLKKVLLFSHSSFEILWGLISIHNYVQYMSNNTQFPTPIFKQMDIKLTYMEQLDDPGFWTALFKGSLSLSQLSLGLIRNAIATSLEVGAFLLQFLNTWNAQKSNYNMTDLPTATIPSVSIPVYLDSLMNYHTT
ncbi:hypothetical protein JTB14_006561 [Gonioctena quinquepunctata]|nr:hypothetical protein JTB14_006561 [Gonioctena quinquepunctata]